MKSLAIFGIVLVVLGVAGLAVPRITYTTKEKVLDLGPIHATADKEHDIAIPDIAAGIAVIAGLVLVISSTRRA